MKKFTLLFLMLAGVLLTVTGYAQSKTKIPVIKKGITIRAALPEIEKYYSLMAVVSDNINPELNQKIDLRLDARPMETVLAEILTKNGLDYHILDKQIVISKAKVVSTKQTQNSGRLSVTGRVTDSKSKQGLAGVTITVKGTYSGTATDTDGYYKIEIPYANALLIISYLGYQPQEIAVNNRTAVDVELVEDAIAFEEVVIVGNAIQKKETITGSVATITTKDLKQSPTANINNALAGRLPGLIVNQYAGGEPGVDRSQIYIRGLSTYGDQSPIVIVDGVERDMSYLAPEEIETFTILKDASATAQYGIRGANGVIVVTTKRGKAQEKASVSFKASAGINNPIKFPSYLGSADYATLYNEALINDNPGASLSSLNLFTTESIEKFRRAKGDNSDGLGYNWDYFDYIFKPGSQQDYSLSIRGGSDRARYYVMASYFHQGGNYKHTNLEDYDTQSTFNRYNFRSNIDIDITKNFYAKLSLGARITDRNAPGTTASRLITLASTQPPYLPIIVENNDNAENEEYMLNNPHGMLFGDRMYRFNILGELSRNGYLVDKSTYLEGNFVLGHKLDFITKGLSIEGNFSYDASHRKIINRTLGTYSDNGEYPSYATFMPMDGRDIYMTPGHYDGTYRTGNKYDVDQTIAPAGRNQTSVGRTYYQLRLDYARKFGMHDITALILFNRSSKEINEEVPYRYQGLTARATYNYDMRYFFEFNCGYNGSENFHPDRRYGFFPAVSVGWVISNEKFMKKARSWLDMLKIRASYGLVGSDMLPSDRWAYLAFFSSGTNSRFGETPTSYPGMKEDKLANPNLTWEKAQKTNIGIDLTMFRQRLTLAVDLFQEKRYDIITDLSDASKLGLPDYVGTSAPYTNSGEVRNRGVDFEIGWNGNIGRDFHYYIKPNFTFARNKIIYMNEVTRKNPWRSETGHRLQENFVYIFDHFVRDQTEADKLNAMNNGAGFQTWGNLRPGDCVYKDLDGDGQITDEDRMAMGHPRNPELQFGLPIGFSYKGFDFSMLFQGALNTSILLSGPAIFDFPRFDSDKVGKLKSVHMGRWTPETADIATYPALSLEDRTNNKNANSSLFLYDAKYLRLKNIELGYSLPQKWIRKAGFQYARIYLQALNLCTWDKLKDVDIDPEMGSSNGAWYPIQKVYNIGIEITF